ncbi:MAG TPA: cellulase family glycosylhydrolase [Phycisphaerae bacterium]|nr:cellulase family glycosylhydrolase [Phycisphaerae bacterium]
MKTSWVQAALGALLVGQATAAAQADEFVRIQQDQFVLNGQVYKIKGTNYYPRDAMWASMWTRWDAGRIAADAQLMSDLGINAVRILVPYSNGGWNGPNVPQSRLDQLEYVVNIMGDRGIRSVVTLFDWETSFPAAGSSREADHLKYLSAIVNRLRDNPYVFLWDVKNEPDHPDNYGWCDCNPGDCGNWDCNPAKRNQIVSWLERMCNAVRARDPNHPVAAGMRWWQNLSDVLHFQDVAIFHSYWPNISTEEIPQTKALMGSNPKPILVEEWGWPSNPNPCRRDGRLIYDYNETQQLSVYINHLAAFEEHDIAGGLQWMTFDARAYTTNPDESFEQFFGLWYYCGGLKPAGVYYRDHFPVALFPKVTPPTGPVTGFKASVTGLDITLTWTNPGSTSYAGTMIRYSQSGYPATPDDGTLLVVRPARPGTQDYFIHVRPELGVRHYYSAFSYNLASHYAAPAQAGATVYIRADYDGDGDVDLTDFGYLQRCLSGEFTPQTDPSCQKARHDADSDVDAEDMKIFQYCFQGADVPLRTGCSP